MSAEEQQNDHIWVTVAGENWAIRAIHGETFYLWRGYDDTGLEYGVVEFPRQNWGLHAERAAEMLKEQVR